MSDDRSSNSAPGLGSVMPNVITLGDIFHIMWKRKWLCVLITVLFLIVGVFLSSKTVAKYEFTQVMLPAQKGVLADLQNRTDLSSIITSQFLVDINNKEKNKSNNMKFSFVGGKSNNLILSTKAQSTQKDLVRQGFNQVLSAVIAWQATDLDAVQTQYRVRIALDKFALQGLKQTVLPKKDKHREVSAVAPQSQSNVDSSSDLLLSKQMLAVEQNKLQVAYLSSQNLIKNDLMETELNLENARPARLLGNIQQSSQSVNLSAKLKIILMFILGLVVSLFLVLVLEFASSTDNKKSGGNSAQ